MTYSRSYYRAWAALHREQRRIYRTAWAAAHYKSKAHTRQCEQVLCTSIVPARRRYCDECKHANRLWNWGEQNSKRRRAAA